jgi:hypothetical protein
MIAFRQDGDCFVNIRVRRKGMTPIEGMSSPVAVIPYYRMNIEEALLE